MSQGTENRTRLVNAAADLFWRNGYDGTSLSDIAEAASVPLGNIYYYYKSKAALAEDVSDLIARQTGTALDDLDQKYSRPAQRLIGLIDLLSASNEARALYGCPIARSALEFRSKVPSAAERTSVAFTTLQDWLMDQFQAVGYPAHDAQTTAMEWISRWQGAIIIAHATSNGAILDRAMGELRQQAEEIAKSDDYKDSPLSSLG